MFHKVTTRPSFMWLRVNRRIYKVDQIPKWKITYKDSVVSPYLNFPGVTNWNLQQINWYQRSLKTVTKGLRFVFPKAVTPRCSVKRSLAQVFACEFCGIFKNTSFIDTSGGCFFISIKALKVVINSWLHRFCLNSENVILHQNIDISMGSDPVLYMTNLFSCYYEKQWLSKLKNENSERTFTS